MSGQEMINEQGKNAINYETGAVEDNRDSWFRFTDSEGEQRTGFVSDGQVKDADGNVYENVYRDESGKWIQDNTIERVLDYKVQEENAAAEVEGVTNNLKSQNNALADNRNLIKSAIVDSKDVNKFTVFGKHCQNSLQRKYSKASLHFSIIAIFF